MTTTPQLQTILKDSAYKLTQFSSTQIQALENRIIIKQVRDKAMPYAVFSAWEKNQTLARRSGAAVVFAFNVTLKLSFSNKILTGTAHD